MVRARSTLVAGLAAVLCGTAFSGICAGQEPAPKAQAVVSPEVMPDRRVTLRLRAPEAKQVVVEGDFEAVQNRKDAMVRSDDGVWRFTTEALSPDIYSYDFVVDGVPLADPVNGLSKPGIPTSQSVFVVPGAEIDDLQAQAVPHGEVRVIYYTSHETGRVRRLHIYLPPGYAMAKRRYPVVYLFHGGGDDDAVWTSQVGRANFLLDNLIAAGRAKPMILVMPDLRALGDDFEPIQNEAVFRRELLGDIIPLVDRSYRTQAGPAGRAVGGLGMGRPWLPQLIWPVMDAFGEVMFVSGGVSPALFKDLDQHYPGAIDSPKTRRNVRFFLGVGESDGSRPDSENFGRELQTRGYRVAVFQGEGAHGWPSFRRAFRAFVEQAFRN